MNSPLSVFLSLQTPLYRQGDLRALESLLVGQNPVEKVLGWDGGRIRVQGLVPLGPLVTSPQGEAVLKAMEHSFDTTSLEKVRDFAFPSMQGALHSKDYWGEVMVESAKRTYVARFTLGVNYLQFTQSRDISYLYNFCPERTSLSVKAARGNAAAFRRDPHPEPFEDILYRTGHEEVAYAAMHSVKSGPSSYLFKKGGSDSLSESQVLSAHRVLDRIPKGDFPPQIVRGGSQRNPLMVMEGQQVYEGTLHGLEATEFILRLGKVCTEKYSQTG